MAHADVVVVGGGLAGWAAAATAAGGGRRVVLVDPTGRGGRAATDVVSGFALNRGAHALYVAGPGHATLRRLGIRPAGGRPPLTGARARRGPLVGPLPISPAGLASGALLDGRARRRVARVLASIPRWRPAELAGRSTAAWFDDLGLEGDARSVVAMLVRLSTYAADLDALPADVAAGQVRLGLRGVRYLDGGWDQLVGALRAAATGRGVEERRQRVHRVEPAAGGAEVTTDDGRLDATTVVLAAGSPAACSALLPEPPEAWAEVGPPSLASCLDLGLATEPAATVLLGIDRPLYAIRHTPAATLAPPGGAVVHALRYLRADEHPEPAAARAELEEHLRLGGFHPDEAVAARYLHRMVTVSALPRPGAGLAGRPSTTSAGAAGVLVAGDWVGPTGYLADGSLASGEAAGIRAAARAGRSVPVA